MRRTRPLLIVAAPLILSLAIAAPARAQWYVGVNFGGNHTQPATVSIEAPSQNLSVQFHEVRFAAQPLKAPMYYGWRLGRMLGRNHRLGVEFEFIHLKVIADTSRTYVLTPGAAGGSLGTSFAPMNATVQRYAMSHGLNLALVNLVFRAPLGPGGRGRVSLDLRGGAGPSIPHAESTVLGESRDGFEYGGLAALGGIGTDVRINGRLSLLAEYKVTIARPEITLAHGTGRTTAFTHHVTGGLLVNLSR